MLVLEGSLPFRINVNRNGGEWQGQTLKMSVLRACSSFHVLKKMTEERQGATLGTHFIEAFIL